MELVENILVDATDYIGSDMTRFCADNYALATIRNNKDFHKIVSNEISNCTEEYAEACESQEEAAKFVWGLYKKWAYNYE